MCAHSFALASRSPNHRQHSMRAQNFEGGSPVACMQECQVDLMCKGFVIADELCYFKQDLATPGGLLAAMVSA
jgi:hypothetical protein